ncbi:MAG: hypothetical protein O2877_02905, partial [bacterium]|nr:hypothetical protein [bacterium]
MKGIFLAVDGSEGSGKSLFCSSAITWANENNKTVFDVQKFEKKHNRLPLPEDFADADILITHEPSYTWAGAAIREEMIYESERPYSGQEVAQAISTDRLIRMRRINLPALHAGKHVISDRCVAASIIYQPMMDDSISLDEVLALPGNQEALNIPIDHLFVMLASPEESLRRLSGRTEKNDNAVFDKATVIEKHQTRFKSDWFKEIFRNTGTELHE